MLEAIRLAMKNKNLIPPAVDLITDIQESVKDDGKITKKEQSRLMTKFHALIKQIKTQRKSGSKAA